MLAHVVSDTTDYAKTWVRWWTTCQPAGRAMGPWPFSRDSSEVEWGRLLKGGKHGIFLAVLLLSWWAASLDRNAIPREFTEAITDLNWVICELTGTIMAPTPTTPKKTTLGKHTRKPTEKTTSLTLQKRLR